MATDMDIRPQVAVGALIVRQNHSLNEVLLVKRGREPSAGLWALPGGRVHWGETLIRAVQREVREETGLEIKVGRIIHTFDSITRDENGQIRFHYVIIDFLAHPILPNSHPVAADDAADAGWFTLDQMRTYPVTDTTLALVEKYFAQPL